MGRRRSPWPSRGFPGRDDAGRPADVSNPVDDARARKLLRYDEEDDRPVRLAELYRGRRDMFWEGSRRELKEATYGHYRGHLQGQRDISIYPLLDDATCCWAAVSVKVPEPDRVLDFIRLLRAHEIHAIVVQRFPSSYDITVFAGSAVMAADLRFVLNTLAKEAKLPRPLKIVPTADHPSEDPRFSGNNVPLPYVGACAASSSSGRRPRYRPQLGCRLAIDLERQHDLTLEKFLDHAEARRTTPNAIHEAASRLRDEGGSPAFENGGRSAPARVAQAPERPLATGARRKSRQQRRALMKDPYLEGAHATLVERDAPPSTFQVLFELWRTSSPTGVIWASREAIAARLKCSRATIYRAFDQFRDAGLVEPVPDRRHGGRWPHVGYRLILSGGRQPTGTREGAGDPRQGVPDGASPASLNPFMSGQRARQPVRRSRGPSP